jgi:hypothetical protein
MQNSAANQREDCMKPIRLIACAAALVAFAATAMAQTPPTRLRGSIAALDGDTLTVATRDGGTAKVALTKDWVVMLVSPFSLADIKENSFVGVASMKKPDGTLEALEVLVFPEAARGTGEGHYPWDLQPQSMMTNATVSKVVKAADVDTLTVTYKDGTQTIHVGKGVPVVTFAPGTKEDAKVGAKVFLGAAKAADGSLSAGRILVGKDGLTPPM